MIGAGQAWQIDGIDTLSLRRHKTRHNNPDNRGVLRPSLLG